MERLVRRIHVNTKTGSVNMGKAGVKMGRQVQTQRRQV